MPDTKIKFTLRADALAVAEIDRRAKQHGYATRSKYLIAAGLRHASGSGDEATLRELSRIVYKLHQLARAQDGLVHLLKPSEIDTMTRDVRKALRAVIRRADP
jgi:hypothetical protein